MKVELIFDQDELYRRIFSDWIKEDGTISSAGFQNTSDTNDMSVDLARLTTPEKTVSKYPNCGVALLTAGFARSLDQKVLHDPLPDNIAHSTVKGIKTKSIRRKLALGSIIIQLPIN